MLATLCRGAVLTACALSVGHAQSRLDFAVDRLVKSSVRVAQRIVPPAFSAGMLNNRPYVVEFHLDDPRLAGHVYDFGDGQRARATTVVQHDYRPAMTHRTRTQRFDVRLLDPTGRVVSGRTLTLVSDVAVSREMGFAQGSFTSPQPDTDLACPFAQPMTLTNHEPVRVVYDRFIRTLHPCDPTAEPITQNVNLHTGLRVARVGRGVRIDEPISSTLAERQRRRPSAGAITLDPGASVQGEIALGCEETVDACVVSWRLVGRTADGRKAYADTHAEIARNAYMTQDLNRFEAAFLDALVARELVPDPLQIDAATLRRLEAEGQITRTESGWEVVQ
jgi:hypothetical protein